MNELLVKMYFIFCNYNVHHMSDPSLRCTIVFLAVLEYDDKCKLMPIGILLVRETIDQRRALCWIF